MKVSPVMLFVVHQSDANLIVKQADTHRISHINSNEVQYVTIEVKSSRPNVEPFTIRINGLDFKDLQDRIARTITVLPTVKFHQTLLDQFVDAFKDAVKTNPVYSTDQVILINDSEIIRDVAYTEHGLIWPNIQNTYIKVFEICRIFGIVPQNNRLILCMLNF